MIPVAIGSQLKSARNEAKLSQEQAAEALGVSRQTVSNWETGKSYPDILSVIKMSELYSLSLDRLLKEEASMDRDYRAYLKDSTDSVKSSERKSRLTLLCSVFGIWALCFAAFFLLKDGDGADWYSLAAGWVILPVLFFAASACIGTRNWFGKLKWLAAPVCGLLHAAVGTVSTVAGEGLILRAVNWPDFRRLPVGVALSLAGLALGAALRKRETKLKTELERKGA